DDGHGGEAVCHEGAVVGSTTSVVYGHTVGQILAFAYLDPQVSAPGTPLEVIIAGKARAARVLGAPAYDPTNERPRSESVREVMA
ncbi:MAG: glycine cleavage T C-terminal barrel domain-containing protein, partial [Pseudomonadota bacterium]